ncbi:MAG: hypothetical protein A2046_11555 [Bacteroidetes bacterium GWA2_30_7]|nr:MAG: hypothetical protein A2046_11555 [Bacteroidetes bacterium GWA2_30_7]
MKIRKANTFYLSIAVYIIFLLSSCDKKRYFEEYTEIPNQSWNRNNILRYNVNISDNKIPLNIFLDIRNSGKYNYSNLYVFLKTQSPEKIIRIDTIECVIADDNGRWLGKGIGDLWDNQILVRKNVVFPDTGNYIFEIEQAMRDESLEHISDVGLRIEKAISN